MAAELITDARVNSATQSDDSYMNIEALSKDELLRQLAAIDISVPPRGKQRTNDHVERWVVFRALATLSADEQIEYPVSLVKRERPDFLLSTGRREIGCEVTEAINSDYLRTQSLPEAQNANSVIDVSLFKWNTQKRKLDKLREIASRNQLTGTGWHSNSVEKEYAEMILDVVNNKSRKLAKTGFQKYQENWLLIYINHSLPILDVEESAALCSLMLNEYWSEDSFDSILVEKNENIVVYSPVGHKILLLNDMWKN
jgi:hypothetical protein